MSTMQVPLLDLKPQYASLRTEALAAIEKVCASQGFILGAEVTKLEHDVAVVVLATVTADGRPLVGPVDGYFLHGTFWFSTRRTSVRHRHLVRRPACSATYLPGEELAVTVHGRAEVADLADPTNADLLQAMLDEYVPKVGPEFERGIDEMDAVGIRIVPEKIFTFHMDG